MITLPPRDSDAGLIARLLLAECRGPSAQGFNEADATTCMQLMVLVLRNRVSDPHPYLAKHATLLAVVKAKGQFAGFEHYPQYDAQIAHNSQQIIDIANAAKDQRSADFAAFVNGAISIASAPTIIDPTPGSLTAWRTGGSASPGSNFTLYKTFLATDFYYTQ